jgi:WD40 repeat protein
MSKHSVFRVFISSTFEDFKTERELLRARVWPELDSYCKLRGTTFEAIDLRWGIPANSAEDLDIVSICLNEVERCQKLTPRPNFIALIGNRYGWRPLPVNIPIDVFHLLPDEARQLVEAHYQLDENAIPAAYLLERKTLQDTQHENEVISKIRNAIGSGNERQELADYFFKSATHLEIDEGIFKPTVENMEDHFFACFREIEEFSDTIDDKDIDDFSKKFIDLTQGGEPKHDTDAEKWLNNLRNDIQTKLKNRPEQVGEYSSSLTELKTTEIPPYVENMCLDIENWLKKMIDAEVARTKEIDALEMEKLSHEKFRNIRIETFGGREKLLADIQQEFQNQKERNIICIHGEGGSGKSALMARVIHMTEQNFPDSTIAYRFIGATPSSVDLNQLLSSSTSELYEHFQLDQQVKDTSREACVEAFNGVLNHSHEGKTFVFFDALDQLNDTENAHSLYWLPQKIHEDTVLVLSVLNGEVFNALKRIYPDAAFFDLTPKNRKLGKQEVEAILKAMISKKPARKLQPFQTDYILKLLGENALMLHLKLVAENARHWHSFDSMEAVESKALGIRGNVREQIKLLFDRLGQEDKHGAVFVKDVLSFIALMREGASDTEIKDLLWTAKSYRKEFDRRKHPTQPEVNSLPPIIWSRFFFDMEPFLMERLSGGTIVYDFFHRIFKELVKSDLAGKDSPQFHELMATYFSNQSKQPTRFITHQGDTVYNVRKLTEYPYHQSKAALCGEVYQTLTDFVFLESKVKAGKTYELMEDFKDAMDCDAERQFPLLHLIGKAFRNDVNFIARHPDSFFQCLYNSCWWYDHPKSAMFYKGSSVEQDHSREKLYAMMETWEKVKSAMDPGFYWLKSLQPPSTELDGPQLGLLRGLSSPVIYVSYSEEDDKIYAICNRGEFISWDAETQNIEHFLPLPHESSFMFKPNSKKRFDENTEIMSDKGGVLADHPGFEYWAWSGIISPHGKYLLSGSFDGAVSLVEFADGGNKTHLLSLDPNITLNPDIKRPVRGVAFSGNNQFAATGHADGSLVLWDMSQKTSLAFLTHDEGWINSIAIDQEGKQIISAGGDGIVYLWKKEEDSDSFSLTKLHGHTDRIWSVAMSKDGRYAATGSDDKTVRLWDIQAEKEIKCLKGHTRWVQALAFNHQTDLLVSSGGDGKIIFWDIQGERLSPLTTYPGHDDSILSLSFSANDQFLLSGSRDKSIRIWDVHSEFNIHELEGHDDRITCAAFSKDGLLLVTGSNDQHVRIWDAGSGNPLQKPIDVMVSISTLSISTDNKFIVVGSDTGEIILIDLHSHLIVDRKKMHASRVYAIDISADSKVAASVSQNGELKLWYVRKYVLFLEKAFEGESFLSVALSPDYKQVALGTREGFVKLLRINRDKKLAFVPEEITEKQLFKSWVDDLVFSTDGDRIEARGGSWDDRKLLVLDASSLEIIQKEQQIADGAVGSFGKYRLGFGDTEISIKDKRGEREIAWYPKILEFTALHPGKRQWCGIQRYNLHHFRLEGGE